MILDDDLVNSLNSYGYTGSYAGASTDLPDTNASRDLANAIQKFVWEGVGATGLGTGAIGSNFDTDLYNALGTGWAAVSGSWVDPGNVAILNFTGRQDQLYRTPEPLSFAVWSLLGLCATGRRFRKRG